MATHHRARLLRAGLALAGALTLAACGTDYPNSTFQHTTEFNTAIDYVWDRMLFLGTLVFVFVEALLVYVVIKFRRKPGHPEPKHVHGNTTLEVLWTVIPAVILLFIAVPTVKTIFQTQAKAVPNALQVEVIGHQWWWEFRYPQYGVVTANELYLPVGRTVNFALRTDDVLHSFWIPRLGGKRDLIANHTNYMWFTPQGDSLESVALNGSCNEYCGASHANMKFRTFTVSQADFERWARHQAGPAVGTAPSPTVPDSAAGPAGSPAGSPAAPATAQVQGSATPQSGSRTPSTTASAAAATAPAAGGTGQGVLAGAAGGAGDPYWFPAERLPAYVIPSKALPTDIPFDQRLQGDAVRGQTAFLMGGCASCHAVQGNPAAARAAMKIGPDLTHFGTRHTFASALYPSRPDYLRLWIKNAPLMKPGSRMPTLGRGETNPQTGFKVPGNAGLTDQQVADVVAYIQSLK